MFYAVVLAGGTGTRFWPLSRMNRPKQLLSIGSEKTMIEETVERMKTVVRPENIIIITSHLLTIALEEKLFDIPPENILPFCLEIPPHRARNAVFAESEKISAKFHHPH